MISFNKSIVSIRIAWISKLHSLKEFSLFENCQFLTTHPSTEVPLAALLVKQTMVKISFNLYTNSLFAYKVQTFDLTIIISSWAFALFCKIEIIQMIQIIQTICHFRRVSRKYSDGFRKNLL